MLLNWNLAERIQCGLEEKRELVSTIDLVVQASEKSRRDGLLALEIDIDGYKNPLLKIGMKFIVEGTDPDVVRDILATRILTANKSGMALLEQLIIMDSLLSIQSGDSSRILMAKCFAYLGDAADDLQEEYSSKVIAKHESEMFENYKKADGNVSEYYADTRKILSLDDRAVQKVLRELDTAELAAILEGSESDVRKKVLRNMSQRASKLLVMNANQTYPGADSVKNHVEKVFRIVAKLKEAGEIA